MMNFNGKTVMITGAARGIGFATAEAFIARGANVAICDMGQNVFESAEKLGKSAMGFIADVTKREQAAAFVAATVEKFGAIDVLVNNAGITRDAQFLNMTDEMWDMVLAVNLKSMFIVTQEAFKVMLPAGGGCVIGLSSISANWVTSARPTTPRLKPAWRALRVRSAASSRIRASAQTPSRPGLL
jgi:NAD(P)-dependent dehydrogenase (short-subunit alcohol dehydrogenase family)